MHNEDLKKPSKNAKRPRMNVSKKQLAAYIRDKMDATAQAQTFAGGASETASPSPQPYNAIQETMPTPAKRVSFEEGVAPYLNERGEINMEAISNAR